MSILAVTELTGRKLRLEIAASSHGGPRLFHVETDDPETSLADILAHADIPKRFDPHPHFATVFVRSVEAVQLEDAPADFIVTAEYGLTLNPTKQEDPGQQNPDPLLRPRKLRYFWQPADEPGWQTAEDPPRLPLNSAGEAFDPPLIVHNKLIGFRVERNISTTAFSPAWAAALRRTINSTTFHGFPEKTVRIDGFEAEETWEDSHHYWRIAAEFLVKDDEWIERPVDQGYSRLISGKRERIRDRWGQLLAKPVRLDGAGDVLGDEEEDVTLEFPFYRLFDYNALGFFS